MQHRARLREGLSKLGGPKPLAPGLPCSNTSDPRCDPKGWWKTCKESFGGTDVEIFRYFSFSVGRGFCAGFGGILLKNDTFQCRPFARHGGPSPAKHYRTSRASSPQHAAWHPRYRGILKPSLRPPVEPFRAGHHFVWDNVGALISRCRCARFQLFTARLDGREHFRNIALYEPHKNFRPWCP